MPTHAIQTIHRSFKTYEKEIRDIWESYCVVTFYMPKVHDLVKSGELPPLTLTDLGDNTRVRNEKDTYGAIHHMRVKAYPRRTLVEAVSAFEEFLSFLVQTVYSDHPGKLINNNPPSEKEEQKLLELVINSADRDEILEKIIEEKVRGIFYGKPSDFFLKSKVKLDFGDYFSSNCTTQIEQYEEITARRNLVIHNGGRVDRKYLREVKGSALKLGQVATLNPEYLANSLSLLRSLAAVAAAVVVVRVYSGDIRGILSRVIQSCAFAKGLPIGASK